MTREQAIEHGKSQLEVFGGEHREFIKLAIKALEQEPRWISSDNPPRRTMRVLVDYEITRYMGVKRSIRDVGIGCYCNGWHIENHNGEKVEMKIHKWMPLPESEDNK